MDAATRDRALRLAGYFGCALAASMIVLLVVERGLGRYYASYDLSAYVNAAERLARGEPLYPQLAAGAYRLGDQDLYLYPPPVALLFLPALLLPFELVATLWGIALTALAAVVALGLARTVAPVRRPLAAALTLGAFPLQWELAVGNLTLVTLALVLAAWRWRTETIRAAAPLALAAGLKLLAAPLLGTLALAGRWRLVIATVALLAASVALTWPFVGAAWTDWATLTSQLAIGPQTGGYNVVPEPLRAGPGRLLLLSVALAALAACGILVRTKRLKPDLAFAAALAAAPFVSAFVHYPYAVFLLPLVVRLTLGDAPTWARAAGLLAWLLAGLQALDPATVLPSVLLATAIAVGAAIALGRGGVAGHRIATAEAADPASPRRALLLG